MTKLTSSTSTINVRYSFQRGVSLIELMVAMIIALLIAAAVGSLFVTSKNNFQLQSGTSSARESALATIEDLSREIRRSGNYGCFVARDTGGGPSFLTTARLPQAQSNRFPIPTIGLPGNLTPRVGPNFAVYADNVSSLPTSAAYTVVSGSDFLEFNFGDPVTFLDADMDSGTDPLTLGQQIFVSSGQPLLLSSCSRMTLLRADNGGTGGALRIKIDHDPLSGDNPALPTSEAYHKFSRGTTVMKLAAARLFVAISSDGTTNLYRHDTIASNGGTPQPFVSNVRDMRVRMALDDGAGGITWNTGAAISAGDKWAQVAGVQVHFVVASSESTNTGGIYEMVWDNAKGFIPGGTLATDGRPRKAYVITTSVRGRNELVGK
jgi:type IV pilus assembly protein PilW